MVLLMNAVVLLVFSPLILEYGLCREYGLLFPDEDSYLQAGYVTFCDECSIKFEVLINRTSGVIIYAENRIRAIKLVVYFERPGMYVNVTDGNTKYNLPLTLDFFSNEWYGWHDIEVRITEFKMFLLFDTTERHALLQGRHLFPEDVVEDNEIYFGSGPYYTNVGNVSRFSGYIRNIKYKSCGCNEWKPIKKLKLVGVRTEDEGECRPVNSCKKECVCYLFSWGSRRCECPDEICPETSNDVGFRFSREEASSDRLQPFNKSASWISSKSGPFGNGMVMTANNSLVLHVVNGRTCFRNIFLCENGFSYVFWLLLAVNNSPESAILLLKHSSSIESTNGLTVKRLGDIIEASLTTYEGLTFSVRSNMVLSIWNRVTIIYNQTHLSIYVNSLLKQSTNRSIQLSKILSNVLSTRFLFIGNNRDTTYTLISNFQFSTNITIQRIYSIEELRFEQYTGLRKINLDCTLYTEGAMVDLTSCYDNAFGSTRLTEFHISLIFYGNVDKMSVLIEASFIHINVDTSNVLVVKLGGLSYKANLIKEANGTCYVEISLNSEGNLMLIQNLHTVLLNLKVSTDDPVKTLKIKVNSDFNTLRFIRIINVNRDFAAQALRVIKNDIPQHFIDFDSLDIDNYRSLHVVDGFIDKGIILKYPNLHISSKWFLDSCIRQITSCYHGITLSFWLNLQGEFQNDNERYFKLFSSGNNGITLFIEKKELYFIVIIESKIKTKFIPTNLHLVFGRWNYVEITISQNGIVSLYLNRKETQRMVFEPRSLEYKCSDICLGDERNYEHMISLLVDEIRVWDVARDFLYGNGYLSSGPSAHKLVSFTNYQLNKDFTMEGSAKIISTKFGYGLGLINFGPRYASINKINSRMCFWNLNLCQRGLSIRMSLRPDNLAISNQVILASPSFTVAINKEYLVIEIRAFGKLWVVISKDHLQLFTWHLIEISWHRDCGLKAYINGKATEEGTVSSKSPRASTIPRALSVGIDVLNSGSGTFATVVIDDIEFYGGDRVNLAYESYFIDDSICNLIFNFDDTSSVTKSLGIIGNAGSFQSKSSDSVKIPIPQCFNISIAGCKMCFTLRLWINIHMMNVEILNGGYLTLHVQSRGISIGINNIFAKRLLTFSCPFDGNSLIKRWNFLEVSWDLDEGLIFFINRQGVVCDMNSSSAGYLPFRNAIELSKEFIGSIDEIEMYHKRIGMLYQSKTVNESNVLAILEKLKEKDRIEKEVELLRKALHSVAVNRSVEIVDSFQFNGSNYVSYKLPKSQYNYIPGGREEVEISFKSFNNVQNSIIWISDSKHSKNTLTLKYKKLFFTKVYLRQSSNMSNWLTEEVEIHDNILPNVLHNVEIYQMAGEIVIKTTSMNESNTQSMIGRAPLLPIDSSLYFGGYHKQNFSNQINSSLFGLIYKARIKESNKNKVVDIIQEMTQAKLNPDITNHGNVLINKKVVKPNMFQKTLFLAYLSFVKMPLMINNPFLSLILPKWDFSVMTSIEIEFSTFESRGQILFIGNITNFISLEIFDSQLFFTYKNGTLFKRIRTHGSDVIVSDNKVQNIYIGRDLSGNIKVYFNRDEVVDNHMEFRDCINSVTVIGHIGKYDAWPLEIMSRVSFLGCIHFIRIDDGDFVNFTQNSQFVKYGHFNLYDLISKDKSSKFTSGMCEAPSTHSCEPSPCKGGWCQLTVNSEMGKFDNNFKCNCLYSSKSLVIPFTGISLLENFEIWIYEYLIQSRSKICSEDTKEIVIVDLSFLVISFLRRFPFISVLDIEFLIWTRSPHGCVMELVSLGGNVSVMISEGKLLIDISRSKVLTFSDINLYDNQWHGIEIKIRLQSVQLKINNLQKDFTVSGIPMLDVTSIQVGNCAGYQQSNFKIKGLQYNSLNLLNSIDVTDKNLFFTTKYHYPRLEDLEIRKRTGRIQYPIMFLNNFENSKSIRSFNLSWFSEINMAVTSKYPGVLFHISNRLKFLTCVKCPNDEIIFIHKDQFLKSKIQRIKFKMNTLEFKVIIDLLRQKILLKRFNDDDYKELLLGIDSWNIEDSVDIQFGINNDNNNNLNLGEFDGDDRKCLEDALYKPVIGCLNHFTWSNGNNSVLIDTEWPSQMQNTPLEAVILGKCRDVEKCLPDTCLNGLCTSTDRYSTHCDCSGTDSTGERCHLIKDKCKSIICNNNGQCVTTKDHRGIDITYCNCSGTGYTGERCQQIVCTKEYCLNNGECYSMHNRRLCDCNSTMFTGSRCERATCKLSTCNGHGTCGILSNVSVPICRCDYRYSGDYCNKEISDKCETVCQNGGKCSFYHALMKFCSNKYCRQVDSGNCSCDHTFYKGDLCEEAEIGFDPRKNGALLMENTTLANENYLRVLFENNGQKEIQTLFTILKTVNDRINIYVLNETLKIEYSNQYGLVYFEGVIGKIDRNNVVLLTEGDSEINFYFNNKMGKLKLRNSLWKPKVRRKRDVQLPYPTIIFGCNANMKNCFDGVIAGIRWNDRLLMDPRNKIIKDGKVSSINHLQVLSFPTHTPFFMPRGPISKQYFLIVFSVSIVVIIFAFYVVRRLWSNPILVKKIYVNEDKYSELEMSLIQPVEMRPMLTVPESSEEMSSQCNNESIVTIKTISSRASLEMESSRILLINNVDTVNRLYVVDYVTVPGDQMLIVVNDLPEIKISQSIFPLNSDDNLYKCTTVNISSAGHYVYCHMTSYQNVCSEEFEIQAWRVDTTYELLTRPPNVKFTHSVPFSDDSYQIILLNNLTGQICQFDVQYSTTIWTSTVITACPKVIEPLILLATTNRLIINRELCFEEVDIRNGSLCSTHRPPLDAECQQIIDADDDKLILLTDDFDLYHWSVERDEYDHKQLPIRVTIVSRAWSSRGPMVALGMETGEVHLSMDTNGDTYIALEPRNDKKIVCLKFSKSGGLLAAGFENNIIHVWKLESGPSLCHFHAIHERGVIYSLDFSSDNRKLIAGVLTRRKVNLNDKRLLIIHLNSAK